MRVLFATAELAPAARVGGLAEAAGGLVRALWDANVDVEVVLPDYTGRPLGDERVDPLDAPAWFGEARIRRGLWPEVGQVTLVDAPALARPHPYLRPGTEQAWPDNDLRFFGFAAAVAELARVRRPDVLHLNDWHTAAALGYLDDPPPSVLTIHTLAYQGVASGEWLARLAHRPDLYEWYGGTNPLAGAINLADRIVAVSPTYANEIRTPEMGMGLHDALADRSDALVGIRNGIDATRWNPLRDGAIAEPYGADSVEDKDAARRALRQEFGWPDDKTPVIGMVTRLTSQKGIDLALDTVPYLEDLPARLVMLGSGDSALADRTLTIAADAPEQVAFVEGYDDALSHRIFAGADLLLMPSRFEPCGLAQMQAMAYGTIPVVTDVGGLHDTVVDADRNRKTGTGFVAKQVDETAVVDALHRAVRAWSNPRRRRGIQLRGMQEDWSWREPARRHIELYSELVALGNRGDPAG